MRKKPIPDPPVADMMNLGPASSEWLRAVGIVTRRDLEEVGAVEAYIMVVLHGFRASLNLLYALEGALRDTRFDLLPWSIRDELKREAQQRLKIVSR